MIRCVILSAFLIGTAYAQQWEPSLASVASLRTGGAKLVSSDALTLRDGKIAMVTYWEARSESDLDFYRCIDISDQSFLPVSQQCWRSLRPTGRAPHVFEHVTSSEDLCGHPEGDTGFSVVASCVFTEPFVVQTPFFGLMVRPFENGGLIAAKDGGRYLLVTDDRLPPTAFIEIRAQDRAAFYQQSGFRSLEDLLAQPPENLRCQLRSSSSRDWVSCESIEPPFSGVRYTATGDFVYIVTVVSEISEASQTDEEAISLMFGSLSVGSQ